MADADANNNNDNNEGNNNEAPRTESITLKVRSQTGDETMFKVKKTTKMMKVFKSYAELKGVLVTALRFFCDGTDNETPADLNLEDDDQIDVILEQQGGGGH